MTSANENSDSTKITAGENTMSQPFSFPALSVPEHVGSSAIAVLENTFPTITREKPNIGFTADIIDVSSGPGYSLFLDRSGKVIVSGLNNGFQYGLGHSNLVTVPKVLPLSAKIKLIAAGQSSCIAVTEDNSVYTWGREIKAAADELDGDEAVAYNKTPKKIGKLDEEIIGVDIDGGHALVVTKSGKVYIHGANRQDSQSIGEHVDSLKQILFPAKIVKVSTGPDHSMALDENGTAYMWGKYTHGYINEVKSNKTIAFGQKIVDIGALSDASMILTESGEVYGCGNNGLGVLGIGKNDAFISKFTKMKFDQKVKALYAKSPGVAYFVAEDNKLYVCGIVGGEGRLVVPLASYQDTAWEPTQVAVSQTVARLFKNNGTTFFTDIDGQLWAFGVSNAGEMLFSSAYDGNSQSLNYEQGLVKITPELFENLE